MEEIIYCPWCNMPIEVVQLNCSIFRCGVYKDSWCQIMPHLPKEECDKLVNVIWGCSRPFRIINGKVEKCDYI